MADTPLKADKPLKVGQRVLVLGKDEELHGKVAFVGTTLFSPGKWVGVILDQSKGKNNGTVMGKTYFSCKDNHGMFVRPTQLQPIEEDGGASHDTSQIDEKTPRGKSSATKGKSSSTATGKRKIQPVVSSMARRPPRLPIAAKAAETVRKEIKEEPEQEDTPPTPQPTMSKRSSFVETGFVETLKAQFTPGQPVSPSLSMAIEERVTVLQLSQENENIRAELKDALEKLETLKIKRNQDRDKLKEAEKMRLQNDQLLEFKKAILESQAQLQKDLQKARLEAQEAKEARDRHIEETADISEALEMATLDKEMAEEKADQLQAEVEQCKQRIEELTIDLELANAELEKGGSGDGVNVLQVKQLEKQNAMYKETLIKMRDLSVAEKHELQRAQKELEQKKNEITELVRGQQNIKTQLQTAQSAIAELQEQVDAALGAEEMVERLTERNLTLEEKLQELEDAVRDLEELQQTNDELQETARETELELRQELDQARAAIRQVQKEREAAQELVADRDATIAKFRDLVTKLQEQNADLREALEKETQKPHHAPSELLDFRKMLVETKAAAKSIDLDLRKLEVAQALRHVQYLKAYMPETYMTQGGDEDSVQVLLLLPRLIWKADILASQIKDKFPAPEKYDLPSIIKSPQAERYSFACRMEFVLTALQCIWHQFNDALNSCAAPTWLQVGALAPEMAPYEKVMDFFLDLLRKDQIDENISLEPLEKALNYFQTLYPKYLKDERINASLFLIDQGRLLNWAAQGLISDCVKTYCLLAPGHEGSDVALLLRQTQKGAEELQGFAKTLLRRIPADGSGGVLVLSSQMKESLLEVEKVMEKMSLCLFAVGKSAQQQAAVLTETDSGIPVFKLRELSQEAGDRVYGGDEGIFSVVPNALAQITDVYQRLTQMLLDGQLDFDGTPEQKVNPAPVFLRAQTLKAELKDLENRRFKLEQKEVEIKELRVILKLKQEEMSELQVRRDMAERKVKDVLRDAEVSQEKLTRKCEDLQNLLKRKEKEFEETVDHLQNDISTLESEKAQLKERLLSTSKKAVFDGLLKTSSSPSSPVHTPTATTVISSVKDSPMLLGQIEDLRSALQLAQERIVQLQGNHMKEQMASLKPLKVPKQISTNGEEKRDLGKDELIDLSRKTSALFEELYTSTVRKNRIIDLTEKNSKWQLLQNLEKQKVLQDQTERLQASLVKVAAERYPGTISTPLAEFPTPQLTKSLNDAKVVEVGKLVLPSKETSPKSSLSILLDRKGLEELHAKLLPLR